MTPCLFPDFAASLQSSQWCPLPCRVQASKQASVRGECSFSPSPQHPSNSSPSTAYNVFSVAYQSALFSKVPFHFHIRNLSRSVQDLKHKLTHDSLPLHQTGNQLRTTPRQEH